jgi:hypothetical protein
VTRVHEGATVHEGHAAVALPRLRGPGQKPAGVEEAERLPPLLRGAAAHGGDRHTRVAYGTAVGVAYVVAVRAAVIWPCAGSVAPCVVNLQRVCAA